MIIRVNLYISDYAISPFLYGCLASRSSRVKHGRGPPDLRSPRSNPRPPLPESREAETRLPLLKKQTRKSVRYRSALAHCTVISFPRQLASSLPSRSRSRVPPPVPPTASPTSERPGGRASRPAPRPRPPSRGHRPRGLPDVAMVSLRALATSHRPLSCLSGLQPRFAAKC